MFNLKCARAQSGRPFQNEEEEKKESIQRGNELGLTFGEPPQFLGRKDTCRQDGVVVNDSVVRIVSIS